MVEYVYRLEIAEKSLVKRHFQNSKTPKAVILGGFVLRQPYRPAFVVSHSYTNNMYSWLFTISSKTELNNAIFLTSFHKIGKEGNLNRLHTDHCIVT